MTTISDYSISIFWCYRCGKKINVKSYTKKPHSSSTFGDAANINLEN